tara:strand:+ start:2289 stop:3488 length:1200 start_codon:yes stop_codon:yes gene_type:complete
MIVKYFNTNFKNINNNQNIDQNISSIIKKIPSLNIVSDENLLEETKKISHQFREKKEKIIIFGTGGSNLGARALNNIILNNNISLEFYDNIDPINFENNFQNINFDTTGFLVISKSGTTPETLSQFSCIYQKSIELSKVKEFCSNTLIITEFKESPLYRIAKDNNCLLLEHHKDIGGRYSIFSNVGIVPAIISGLNINELFNGASEVIYNINKYKPYDLGRYLTQKENLKFTNNVLMTYSDSLYFFGKWYLQLWAESIGKKNKGITAIHSVGTTDQHSQLQLYLDGPKDKYFTFITTDHSNKGMKINNEIFKNTSINYFQDKTMGDLMQAEQLATIETFKLNNFSFREIYLPKIDEKNLGKLISFSIIETIASCIYLDVDPFDQPAVEQGKKLTKTYLR